MDDPSAERLERIAFHLLTFLNPKVKKRLLRSPIPFSLLCRQNDGQLGALGFSQADIRRIRQDPLSLAEREITQVKKKGFDLIFREDEDYPDLLRQIDDPPDFIYIAGNREPLRGDKLAIVGSRRGSAYGQRALRRLIPDLCTAGLVIVSGMAYGIDSMAHQLTLSQGGGTIGVNAGGLLHLYPAGNMGLIRKILDQGAVISEFPLDLVPRPHLFPIRNRIISGLCRAVLVVEAALRSGSLITARLGVEQNRDVMAVPGAIDSPLASGTHHLIQQGAKLIQSSADILEEYGITLANRAIPSPAITASEKKILDLLGANEVIDMDSLVETLNLSPSEVISLMMGLVLKNLVIEEAGCYRRCTHA